MGTRRSQGFPPRLEALRRRFTQWRRTRKVRSRIPEPLWSAAVKAAEAYGIHPTAKALGVDYYALKKRLDEKSASRSRGSSVNKVAFVEVAAPVQMAGRECILELEDVEGSKLRIHLKGIEPPDLAALSRSLWGVE